MQFNFYDLLDLNELNALPLELKREKVIGNKLYNFVFSFYNNQYSLIFEGFSIPLKKESYYGVSLTEAAGPDFLFTIEGEKILMGVKIEN